jgi:type II secretory pathway pseudopilin PulG
MYLEGQGSERGYAMAALLVSIGVMMILMSVAMPVWRHEAQREKEAELVFRGEQYARAVNLYQRKMGPGNFPPSIDILVQQRYLRKKYKDPMTADGEFRIIPVAAGVPQPGRQQTPQRGARGFNRGTQPSQDPASPNAQQAGAGVGGQGGGIMGVVSKSTEPSIRIYHGGTHYNEWTFLFSTVSSRPGGVGAGRPGGPGEGTGGPGGGTGGPGVGRGGRGANPGGRPGQGLGGRRGLGGRGGG